MVNYANGKIYKIMGGDLIYIGSTTQALSKRFREHKNMKNLFDKGNKSKSCSSREVLIYDDCCIILIENFPCENKEQLFARERYYYDNTICVNKQRPMTTLEEKHNDAIKYQQNLSIEQRTNHNNISKIAYHANIERERQRNREKYYNTIETTKAYLEKNKDMLKEKRNERVVCFCGIETSRVNMNRHKKSKKHLELMNLS